MKKYTVTLTKDEREFKKHNFKGETQISEGHQCLDIIGL